MTANELRDKYLEFFRSKGHAIIPSASLLPDNDPSSLFTSSGMQPLINYFLGETHPAGNRIVDSQKCFRAGDIEEVGDSRHTTMFEMLGNWSLGDYFKREQLNWYFEFLTKELKIDAGRLYVTVYRGNEEIGIGRDNESAGIWKEIFKGAGIDARDIDNAGRDGMQGGRIFYYGDDKNWWSRSGLPSDMPAGEPGGPDSEVFYDLGADLKRHENSPWKDQACHVNCDCGRYIEVGNSVFMEYIRTDKGFESLPKKNVDFGGGLERTVMVAQGKNNIFETDLFINIIKKIEELSGKKYQENMPAFEVIADHLKAATFLMGDDKGVAPSNLDQGYIVRRLIRRAVRYGKKLGIDKISWIQDAAKVVIDDYREIYPELSRNKEWIIKNLNEEEEKFSKTLEKGLKEFEKIKWGEMKELRELETPPISNKVDSKTAFNLYQTYGFPLELIQEELERKGMYVDKKEFNEEMKKHQELSRTAAAGKFKGGLADAGEETKKLHTAAHLLLAALRKVLGGHVTQKGSNITSTRLRFDFSHPEKLTDEQKQEVERLVNEAIERDLPVKCEEMGIEEAKKSGAMGVFESKYGEKVKVYTVGKDNEEFSKEICGGPHAEHTGVLGKFRIKKEGSSSAGVRRIKAVLE